MGRDLCRSPAQTPAQSKANSEVRPWFSEPCSVDLQVPYLQRCKCHKLFGLLFQCSTTLKPNFWNFSCCILWTLCPYSLSPCSHWKGWTSLSSQLPAWGGWAQLDPLSPSTAPLAPAHTSPPPVPGQLHSPLPGLLQFLAPFLSCFVNSDLTGDHSFDINWEDLLSIPLPRHQPTQLDSVLTHRLNRLSSSNFHISSVLRTPTTSRDAPRRSTLPDASFQLDTAPCLGPQQHWTGQNHYL